MLVQRSFEYKIKTYNKSLQLTQQYAVSLRCTLYRGSTEFKRCVLKKIKSRKKHTENNAGKGLNRRMKLKESQKHDKNKAL